jgi:hypothetical protein
MTLPELMQALEERGIRIALKLTYEAPAGALTEELQSALAAWKPQLLERLGREALEEQLRQVGGGPSGDPAAAERTDPGGEQPTRPAAGAGGADRAPLGASAGALAPPPRRRAGTTTWGDAPEANGPLAELADWPIPWRAAWGHLANAFEDHCQATGTPSVGVDRLAQDELRRMRREGRTPQASLAELWSTFDLLGSPPTLAEERSGASSIPAGRIGIRRPGGSQPAPGEPR